MLCVYTVQNLFVPLRFERAGRFWSGIHAEIIPGLMMVEQIDTKSIR